MKNEDLNFEASSNIDNEDDDETEQEAIELLKTQHEQIQLLKNQNIQILLDIFDIYFYELHQQLSNQNVLM